MLEAPLHFEVPITRLIVISRYKDDNIKLLEEKYGKKGVFLQTIPLDLESYLIPGAYCLVDDFEDVLTSDKDVIKMMLRASFFWVHHHQIFLNLVFQVFIQKQLFFVSLCVYIIMYCALKSYLFFFIFLLPELQPILCVIKASSNNLSSKCTHSFPYL